jgi:hypothetical protein
MSNDNNLAMIKNNNCPGCGHPAGHHLKGIGCTTIVRWEGKRRNGPEQLALGLSFSDLKVTHAVARSPGQPVLCGCARGE